MAFIVVLSQSQTAVVATRVAASNMTAVMAVEQKEIEAALTAGIGGMRLKQCPRAWPITMHSKADEDAVLNNLCKGRHIVVIESSLRNSVVEVPKFFADNAIVLALMNKSGPKVYGFATTVYHRDKSESWEGSFDTILARAAWQLVQSLRTHWETIATITAIGQRVGCPKISIVYNEAAKQ